MTSTDEAARALAECRRGAIIAPAGCGKTQVIALAVYQHNSGRELVLTHTHAGVDALRERLARLGPSAQTFHLDTIASWALRLARSFPLTAALSTDQPRCNDEYVEVYRAATQLLAMPPIQEILRASYSGVYVDEYQDCTLKQHELVLALSRSLPCRLVGDPLQGVFGFNATVDWDRDVAPVFVAVPGPTQPWRWSNANGELGDWLQEIRTLLSAGQAIHLRDAPVTWVEAGDRETCMARQIRTCLNVANNNGGTAIALHRQRNQCYHTARRLKGLYSCIEPIDSEDLYAAAKRIDEAEGNARIVAVIDFAKSCMTRIGTLLKSMRDRLEKGKTPKVQGDASTLESLLRVGSEDGIQCVGMALDCLARMNQVVVSRRELLSAMKRTAKAVMDGEAATMVEAAWMVRNRMRQRGRRLPRCAMGTTLLVKGLEFDHAVILDGDGYDAQNLYVAMTRASRSLTIISRSETLRCGQNALGSGAGGNPLRRRKPRRGA